MSSHYRKILVTAHLTKFEIAPKIDHYKYGKFFFFYSNDGKMSFCHFNQVTTSREVKHCALFESFNFARIKLKAKGK